MAPRYTFRTPFYDLYEWFLDTATGFDNWSRELEASGGLFDWMAPFPEALAGVFGEVAWVCYRADSFILDLYWTAHDLYDGSILKTIIASINYDFWLLVYDPGEFFRQLFDWIVPSGALFRVSPAEWIIGRIYDQWGFLYPLFTDPLYWVKHLFYDNLPWTYPLFDDPWRWLTDKITTLIWNGDILISDPGRWMRLKLYADYPWLSPIFETPWEWIEMRIVQQWPILRGLFDWPEIWVRHRLEELQPGLGLLIDDPKLFLWETFVGALEFFWPDNTDWLQDIGERILLVLWEGG